MWCPTRCTCWPTAASRNRATAASHSSLRKRVMAGSRTRRARRERSGAVDMNAVVLAQHHFLAVFDRVESALAGASLPWLRAQRREAIAAFVARGFPNARDEDW